MPRNHRVNDSGPDRPAPHPLPRIMIISARVGAGHDGAAAELGRRLEDAGFAVDRRDFLDLLPAGLGRLLSATYHRMLTWAPRAYQRLYASTEHPGHPGLLVRSLVRSCRRRTLRAVAPGTVAVVSTYPGASHVLGGLRLAGRLRMPAFTYLTDFSVHPLWVAPGIDAHLAPHRVPAGQAQAWGAARVTVVSPVTGERFVPADDGARTAARAAFGLPADRALALVVAGSWGVGAVRESAAEILASGAAVPVVVCGANEALAEQLRADGFPYVRGWETDMPGLMRACDVLVQNAGGLTSLEAFASGLPVVTFRCIPGHGRTNAAALDEAGLALWVRDPAALGSVLTSLTTGALGARQRAAGLGLFTSEPGPAAVITTVVAEHAARQAPVARPTRPARRGVRTLAVGLAGAAAFGIAAPAQAGEVVPARWESAAHHLIERYEP
ncbi:glycosyltransferase [Streptomyces liangshanensis]|uniref:glycosyltransferase n=1 Tax=Streptomyces liangshanensis TaxID=2717324 RepID=UPI0036DC908D